MTDHIEPTEPDAEASDHSDKLTPKEVGEAALKFAADTAYAAAGFADKVAERAREFVDKQKQTTGEADTAKAFLESVNAQLTKFVDKLGATYKELSDRGRDVIAKAQAAPKPEKGPKDAPGMFDIDADADTAEPVDTLAEEYVEPEAEPKA